MEENIEQKEVNIEELEFKDTEPSFWNQEKPLVGTFLGSEEGEGDNSKKHFFDVKDEGVVIVWGSYILDERLRYIEIGTILRLTYKGKEKTNNQRELRIYKIEVGTIKK